MNSIIQDKKECYICGTTIGLEEHHCLLGKNRSNAEKYGLKVFLCQTHHRGTNGVHGKNGNELQNKLKVIAEVKWLKHYNCAIEDFIEVFGRNYL